MLFRKSFRAEAKAENLQKRLQITFITRLTYITVSDIFITVNVMMENVRKGGMKLRDNRKGGALTEVTFFVLLSVYQPKHGYAIMKFIEEKTNGRLVLGAGTLYGALTALEEKGWIMPCSSAGGRKKEYLITNAGKEVCNKEMIRLKVLVKIAEDIMEEEYE